MKFEFILVLLKLVINIKYLIEKRASTECKMSNLNLTQIMNAWTKQMGHPLVSVKILNQTHILLNQQHFLFDQTSVPQHSKYK
jgi:hypothetical protein